MSLEAIAKAEDFIKNEKQFQLGFLPVEQANPRTKYLDREFLNSEENGVKTLLEVDRALFKIAKEILNGAKFRKMTESMYSTLKTGGRIVFSGCGATGRLSILLESAFLNFFSRLHSEDANTHSKLGDLKNSVKSIMTGGDYALIRSVEFFEDYIEFGRQQVRELSLKKNDLLIGITATGETSSILGSVMEATSRGSKAYIISCVDEACFKRLERSKLVFELPEVTVVDMPCEAMAIAGSTRMQSTTLEQLIAGASLELALKRILKERAPAFGGAGGSGDSPSFFYENFESLISALQSVQSVSAIAELIRFEEDVYKKKGLVTYFADDFLLDVISDTTERSPTFSLPPFRKRDDKISVPSWAFAKNLMLDTRSAWVKILGRAPRCIEWTKEDYIRMGAGKCILEKLPEIGAKELMKFMIGNEMDFSRIETPENAAVLISCGMDSFLREKFREHSQSYKKQKTLRVGVNENADFNIPYSAPETCLHLFEHLAVKLAMNLVSTGCMVKMGKVTGNWMTSLDISNKKLIDRGTRLISDLCSINYNEACLELFKSQEMLGHMNKQRTPISPVEYTIRRLKEPNGKAQNINGQESK